MPDMIDTMAYNRTKSAASHGKGERVNGLMTAGECIRQSHLLGEWLSDEQPGSGTRDPLTLAYKAETLRQTMTESLEEALNKAKSRKT